MEYTGTRQNQNQLGFCTRKTLNYNITELELENELQKVGATTT